ncbi:MAG: sensor domain-containing diguanylate cyclase [Chromatiales bacterium 21-64-14]|nr:MAG: sensor domain-containing diguanylate cyclase [Chromatiales bacterium 21-64-14]
MLLWITLEGTAAPSSLIVSANAPHAGPIGRYTDYLREAHGRLTLDNAIADHDRGKFTAGRSPVLNFGIGSEPAWIHFRVGNPTGRPLQRQLSINTAWLDQVDIYFLHGGRTEATYHVGDRKAFNLRPVESRYFAFDHKFEPGVSDIFVRVETPDPMVLPIYLMAPKHAHAAERHRDYGYGFLYGFLFALLAYNVMLYAGLREPWYALYSLYLGMFLLMNISYTGHGFEWIWPNHTRWEQWSNPILMQLYGTSGLMFALRFLHTRTHFPRIHKSVIGYLAVSSSLLLLTVLSGRQQYALFVSFAFVFIFTGVMLGMCVIAVKAGQGSARYFLLAAVAAMVGASLTALSVSGLIPLNIWTYHAAEIGMLLDATLLALALTYRFRVGQEEKLRAEQLAKVDPLTQLNNRRAFYAISAPIWNITIRHNRNLSVVLLDIDHFKRINDAHGHARGDEVLVATASALTGAMREQDVIARWGGEEFILLLPETDVREATALAERMRKVVANVTVRHEGVDITVTASFGVAQWETRHRSLDTLISTADKHLYRSKDLGRNRVSYA